MKANIYVTLKSGVLDPQGKAVLNALNSIDGDSIKDVRVGKLIEVEIDETDPSRAKQTLTNMCRKLLSNPVTEDFKIKLVGS